MSSDVLKEQMLTSAGFHFNFDRALFVNRKKKKAFSVEFVEDHSEDELKRHINEAASDQWRFYFNQAPSASVESQLVTLLD